MCRYTDIIILKEIFDMYINSILEHKNMTKYMLSKKSGVPHTTVIDICNGKTMLNKCNVETVYKLAKTLGVSMEDLVVDYVEKRPSFENFKSAICHKVKYMGDIDFLIHTLESNEIRNYFDKRWYLESLYLLAMVDYLSRENSFPLVLEYNDLRRVRLQEIVYPTGIQVMSELCGSDKYKELSVSEAIPEFIRHNIVESEIRNVC